MSTASKAAVRQRLAAIVAVLLVAGVVVATVARVLNEPLRRRGRAPPRRRGGRRRLGGAHHDEGASGDRRGRVPGRCRGVDRQRDQRRRLSASSRSSYASSCSSSPSALRSTHWAPRCGALKRSETEGTPVPAATRGVLFMNLKSGGGKAERFHLVDECTRRGIQPVVLEPGQDWLQVVRDVAASGVDVLGMAGGDGSQAMVGTVAAEMGLPMVVVPAGTRNHLALDLGLDRNDVVGALDGYGEAVERTMDLADVNGHVFVNNVSLGLYAAIVRSDGVPRREGGHDARHPASGVGSGQRTVRPAVHGPRRRGASRRPHHPDLQQPLRHHVRWPGEPASDGHPPARRRGVGAGQAGRRRRVPGRPRIRPSGALRGALVVGDADVRGHVRCPDRDGTRR